MAIPLGTTYRQLEAIGRWMLTGVIVVGMLMWWRPDYHAWGALTAALAAVWMLWLLGRANAGDRTIPGHPFHLALLGPAAVLAWHLAKTGFTHTSGQPPTVAGALNMSMVFQLAMLSLGVMLVQSLLPWAGGSADAHPPAGGRQVLRACGAAMMGGAAAAIAFGHTAAVRSALSLLGFAGVCVWLAPLWGPGGTQEPDGLPGFFRRNLPPRRWSRALCVAVAASGAALLCVAAPHEALLAAGVVGVALFLSGLVFSRNRAVLLVAGGLLAGLAAAVARLAHSAVLSPAWLPRSVLGRGETAFADVYAADSGMAILADVVGWAGLGWLVAGLTACTVVLMWRARRGHPGDRARAIVWTAATALTSCAFLAPAGPFIPAVTLAGALTWGLLPSMLGRATRERSGAILLGVVVAVMALQGLARRVGLLAWGAETFGLGDAFLHLAVGFALAMTMAWYLGARKAWWGMVGIVLAWLAGGVGELAQGLLSDRTSELGDWLAHSAGVAMAVPLYLLAMGSRGCESPDAIPKDAHDGLDVRASDN